MAAPQHSARSFRLVCTPEQRPMVENLLSAEGYEWIPEPFSPWCRKLTKEPAPLGSSIAAFFGYIYIQDRSSMLPPLALNPREGAAVLDMCASPGSKTGFLAQLVGPQGFVMGNEPNPSRLATLRQNLFTLNLLHTATCSYGGEEIPLPAGGWEYIQLDPPCSGWGTVEKNPNVMELWQGDKVKPLVGIQRKLLEKAAELLAPGGKVVFSTCTTNVQENEEQVRWAVETLGLELEPIEPFAGFTFEAPYLSDCEGTLRVDPQASGAQGFYIAAFRKPLAAGESSRDAENAEAEIQTGVKLDTFAADSMAEGDGVVCIDAEKIPAGELADIKGSAVFLPRYALETFPVSFRWRGYPAGKVSRGEVRPSPRLRTIMRDIELSAGDTTEHHSGNSEGWYQLAEDTLVVETPDVVRRLLTGQSLNVKSSCKEMGLYYKQLPLGRLRVKGKRALWTEK